jgi:iron complex outermembrane receptor protein
MSRAVSLILACNALLFLPLLRADPSTDQPADIFPLPEVTVTARKIDAPRSVIVREATSTDISVWNAQTAADALISVPGVNILNGGGSGDARVWIRGFRDRDLLLLYDGVPVAQSFEGGFDLNDIALEGIGTIKVLKGAPSVIYGTNGLGGVVDVVPMTRGSGNFINGRVELGTDKRRLLSASGGGGDGNFSFALAGQHQKADDYSLSDDYVPLLNQPRGERINSDYERNSVLFQFDAMATPIGHASMFVNLADSEKGLPIEAGVTDPDFERLTESKRQTVGLSNQFSRIPLSLKLYYNRFDSELTVYTDESYSRVDEIEASEDLSYGAKVYSTLDTSSNNSLVLSGSVQTDKFQAENELELGNKAELTTYTAAIEDQFWVSERLSLAAGAIYSYFDQTQLGISTTAFNPQIAVAWQARPTLRIHASAAQRTRFPKMRELYRRRYGNPQLDPQTANNYEIGVAWTALGEITSDFIVYRSDVDDLIERPDRRSRYENLDRITFQGIETTVDGWFTDSAFFRLAYSYLDAEETLPGGDRRQLRSRPKHTAQAEFRYRFSRDILISFNGVYLGGLYDLDPDGNYTKLDERFVLHARMSVPLFDHYEAYASISNLGDSDYEDRWGYPREGRAFKIGMSLKF